MKKPLLFIVLFVLTFIGCSKFDEQINPLDTSEDDSSKPKIATRTLSSRSYTINPDNPYALKNVQAALDSITAEQNLDRIQLRATHNYVRFLPQDTTHMYILVDSLDLDMFPYPMDYMLTNEEMEEYENATINGYAWQYCIVEPDFPMPTEMESELLDYAYLQSVDEPATRSGTLHQLSNDIYEQAIGKSMIITGNAEPQKTRDSSIWWPSARITYVTDVPGEAAIPLEGILVRANTFLNSTGDKYYTDYNGVVSGMIGKGGNFTNQVQYKIIWKKSNDIWKIRDKNWGKIKTEAPYKMKDRWNFQISGNDQTAMCATIHRALHTYFYEGWHSRAAGLTKINNMNVWAHHGESHSKYWGGYFQSSDNNQIHIYGNGRLGVRSKLDILSTMFHELGHASHYYHIHKILKWDRDIYYHNAKLKETWANGVNYAYMVSMYPNAFANTMVYQSAAAPSDDHYTAIVESLMNQGITLRELQNIFMGKTDLEQCRQPVKDLRRMPNNVVDMIFDHPLVPVRARITNIAIEGAEVIGRGVEVSYSVPNFNGITCEFTIPGAKLGTDYRVVRTSTIDNRRIWTIVFLNMKSFTVTASYDVDAHTVSKIVNVTPPTPVISANKTLASTGDVITFTIKNYQPGATYHWFIQKQYVSYIPVLTSETCPTTYDGGTMKASCYASVNDQNSYLSNTVTIWPPFNPVFDPGDVILKPGDILEPSKPGGGIVFNP